MFARWFALVVVSLLVAVAPARATLYTSIVAFGDSLSDDGASRTTSGGPPSALSSDGPVAVQYLATRLGIPLYDYAVSGARTDNGNSDTLDQATGVAKQVEKFLLDAGQASPPVVVDNLTLYLVSGGSNDVLDALLSGLDLLDPTAVSNFISTVAGNLGGAVMALYDNAGARHFLLPGLPDIGLTPLITQDPNQTPEESAALSFALSAFVDVFNSELLAVYQSLIPNDAEFTYFDLAGSQRSILGNAVANGLTNTTSACTDDLIAGNVDDCTGYFFFDALHPTTAASALVAADLAAAIPEPATLALVGTAVVLLSRRRRSATATAN